MDDLAPKLLDRDFARVQIERIRKIAEPLLQDVIDAGVGAFVRCSQTAPDGDDNLAILFPFHHILEMADGVQLLLSNSGVAASQPVLRAAFESLVGLKYVLKADTTRRAFGYVVADIKDRLRWYEAMDPETERGKRYREDIDLGNNPDYPFPSAAEARAGRQRLENLLADEPYKPHALEYDRTQKARKRTPAWYSLYDGPRSFRELTKATGDLDDYVVLYAEWSKTTHGVDLSRQVGSHPDKTTIRVIRAPGGIEQRYLFAIYFVLDAMRRVLEYYRPAELPRHATWYRDNISARLERLERIVTNE